jgi:hypothetical protein
MYQGTRVRGVGEKCSYAMVTRSGILLDIEPSLQLREHSPTGFEWGYPGSGPAQLALAILFDVTKDASTALRHYQMFKQEFVANWPHESWCITSEEVLEWLCRQQRESVVAGI